MRPLVYALVIVLHLVFSSKDYDMLEAFLAGSCGAIALSVILGYFTRTEPGLPVLEWVIFQLYVYLAMPVFFYGVSTRFISFHELSKNGAILEALFATNLFVLCLLAGWRLVRKRAKKVPPTATAGRVSPAAIFAYGLVSLLVAHLLALYEWEIRLEWYRAVLRLLFSPTIAQILLLFQFHGNPRDKFIGRTVFIFTGLMVVQGIFTGRLDYTLSPLLAMGIGLVAAGQPISKGLIVATLAILLVLNPAKHVYRQLTAYRTADFATLTVGQMVDFWKISINQAWDDSAHQKKKAFDGIANRLNYISINATVIDAVPNRVPYAAGETWLAIPYSVVPRFLWRGKPNLTEITNDAFNLRFGLTTWRIAERSTNSYPNVADGYWNLGWLGVAIVGLLSGLFWKVVYVLWTPERRLLYVITFVLLINNKAISAFPHLLIGVPQVIVACFIVIKFLEILTYFEDVVKNR